MLYTPSDIVQYLFNCVDSRKALWCKCTIGRDLGNFVLKKESGKSGEPQKHLERVVFNNCATLSNLVEWLVGLVTSLERNITLQWGSSILPETWRFLPEVSLSHYEVELDEMCCSVRGNFNLKVCAYQPYRFNHFSHRERQGPWDHRHRPQRLPPQIFQAPRCRYSARWDRWWQEAEGRPLVRQQRDHRRREVIKLVTFISNIYIGFL